MEPVNTSQVVRTTDVIGVDVQNLQEEDLGEIKEIVLDKITGAARYVVLSFGGFLGLGDKLFALPWEAISYEPSKEVFILNLDQQLLKNAPGFDPDNWPNMADRQWEETIFSYYKIQPYWDTEKEL